MLTLPALKVQQFSLQFYLLNLAAADVERGSSLEVLPEKPAGGGRSGILSWCGPVEAGFRAARAFEPHIQTVAASAFHTGRISMTRRERDARLCRATLTLPVPQVLAQPEVFR